jgi:hypothetical protein
MLTELKKYGRAGMMVKSMRQSNRSEDTSWRKQYSRLFPRIAQRSVAPLSHCRFPATESDPTKPARAFGVYCMCARSHTNAILIIMFGRIIHWGSKFESHWRHGWLSALILLSCFPDVLGSNPNWGMGICPWFSFVVCSCCLDFVGSNPNWGMDICPCFYFVVCSCCLNFVGSNPNWGMDISPCFSFVLCLFLFCVCVALIS